MAVTPLRAPRGPAEEPRQTPRLEIVNDDPQPSPKRPPAVKLVVDEDGLIELRIGGGPQKVEPACRLTSTLPEPAPSGTSKAI